MGDDKVPAIPGFSPRVKRRVSGTQMLGGSGVLLVPTCRILADWVILEHRLLVHGTKMGTASTPGRCEGHL